MAKSQGIVIGGGGLAGLSLALALRQGLGPDIPVIVADPAFAVRPSRDQRASAIVAACRRLFETLGVWSEVAPDAQPILDMVVTDSRLHDATRPAFLTFAGEVAGGEPFAHMVENRHLIDALTNHAEASGVELRNDTVATYEANDNGVQVAFGSGDIIIEYDGRAVASCADLEAAARAGPVGMPVQVTYVRSDRRQRLVRRTAMVTGGPLDADCMPI